MIIMSINKRILTLFLYFLYYNREVQNFKKLKETMANYKDRFCQRSRGLFYEIDLSDVLIS